MTTPATLAAQMIQEGFAVRQYEETVFVFLSNRHVYTTEILCVMHETDGPEIIDIENADNPYQHYSGVLITFFPAPFSTFSN